MKIILVSHGDLAKGVLSALEVIFGDNIPSPVFAFGLYTGENVDDLFDLVKNSINLDEKTIIITDLLGGSVDNSLSELLSENNIIIITGMNLSLVLQLVIAVSNNSEEIDVDEIINFAKQGIVSKSEEFLKNNFYIYDDL